jgi:hypothetical protein
VWDVQNPQEIVEQGAKPILQEKGPFGYAKIKEKMNVAFSPDSDYVHYAEAFFYQRLEPRPCELFHAATGVRPVKPCQNDSDIVTVLNVKFMETVHFMTPERIMADVLQEWWAERRQELLTDFLGAVKYRMLPEVFEVMLKHQRRVRAPFAVNMAMNQILQQITAENVVENPWGRVLAMFVDDTTYLPFDCGSVNVSSFETFPGAGSTNWELDLHDVVHESYLGEMGENDDEPVVSEEGGVEQLPERCLWSTKPSVMKLYPRGTTNPGLNTNLLDVGQAHALLGGHVLLGGWMDAYTGESGPHPMNLFANPYNNDNAWLKAAYGDENSLASIAAALCEWGGINATPGSPARGKCDNQTVALIDYLYSGETSWANHSITEVRQLMLQRNHTSMC